jgi:hypothetical protein
LIIDCKYEDTLFSKGDMKEMYDVIVTTMKSNDSDVFKDNIVFKNVGGVEIDGIPLYSVEFVVNRNHATVLIPANYVDATKMYSELTKAEIKDEMIELYGNKLSSKWEDEFSFIENIEEFKGTVGFLYVQTDGNDDQIQSIYNKMFAAEQTEDFFSNIIGGFFLD